MATWQLILLIIFIALAVIVIFRVLGIGGLIDLFLDCISEIDWDIDDNDGW